MSKDNLGNKQMLILNDCLFKDKRYDLAITPHKQKKGFIRFKKKQETRQKSQNKNKLLVKISPEHGTQLPQQHDL